MPGGDHCAVWGCDNDRRYPEKQKILPHVGILRFHSPKSKKDVLSWARAINRDQFKVTKSTKVCSNHFVQGYQTPECPTPTLYMRGYDSSKTKRPAPKVRPTENKEKNQESESKVIEQMKSQLRKCLLWTTSHYLERILTLNIQPHHVLQILILFLKLT